jgi:hypothetical protein
MIAQESSQKVLEEEALVLPSSPASNKSCFLSPNPPSALTSDHLVCLDPIDDPLAGSIDFLVDALNLGQTIGS